jgi:hypothetical protein
LAKLDNARGLRKKVRTYQNTLIQSIDNNINKLRTNQLHEVCNDVCDEYYGIKTNTVADVVIKINRNPPFKL